MSLEKSGSGPHSFDGPGAIQYLRDNLFRYVREAGFDPYMTDGWKEGIFGLFGVQTIGLPDLDKWNYIILSNHISDFDAIILGLLHPRIRIVAKMGWALNGELMDFLGLHYDIVGIYREPELEAMDEDERAAARQHNYTVNKDTLRYLRDDGGGGRHLLIFPQGTISDVNRNGPERVNPGFAKIAIATRASVINLFIEYPGVKGSTRIVCSEPYTITDRTLDYRQGWIDSVVGLQGLIENVREPVLSEKHSMNNRAGERYF